MYKIVYKKSGDIIKYCCYSGAYQNKHKQFSSKNFDYFISTATHGKHRVDLIFSEPEGKHYNLDKYKQCSYSNQYKNRFENILYPEYILQQMIDDLSGYNNLIGEFISFKPSPDYR